MAFYCRITGNSRGLPKPNYFPLLPPISPADAKRLCRITGKAYGLPSHHYIPVLVGCLRPKKKQIGKTSNNEKPFSRKKHTLLTNYRYVLPQLDEGPGLTVLHELLASKHANTLLDSHISHYVYRVPERRCSLIFPANLEAAVKDGDVQDVMLAKDSDTLLLRLVHGGDISVDVKELSVDDMELWDGEGPSEEVLQKRKKFGGTDLMKKLFEDKERAAEEAEEETGAKKSKKISVKISKKVLKPEVMDWKKVVIDESPFAAISSLSGNNNPLFEEFSWEDLENGIIKSGILLTSTLPCPVCVEAEVLDLKISLPGIIQQPRNGPENTVGFQLATVVTPFTPLIPELDITLQQVIQSLSPEKLEATAGVDNIFSKNKQTLDLLPLIDEIPKILENIKNGTEMVYEVNGMKVSGLKLHVAGFQKFVVGQTMQTPLGPVFVPGQTVDTASGALFLPGLTVCTPDGPRLLPGQTIANKGDNTPIFIAGETCLTRDGETFIQGQSVFMGDESKFVPGQTVLTSEGPRFVPGQILLNADVPRFIPGQTIISQDGPHFVPGQTVLKSNGKTMFVPGKSIYSGSCWEFLPGQHVHTQEGDVKFVPGQSVLLKDGQCFLAGQIVVEENNPVFVPGVTAELNGGLTFVPGMSVVTPQGNKFVEGQILKSTSGNLMFVAGCAKTVGTGKTKFVAANGINKLVFHDTASTIKTALIHTTHMSDVIYGHMVQSSHGVEFFPGNAIGLPAGKVVPGQLVRGKEVRFVPGIMIDDEFIPGQLVFTENGEQFIPGQVVETQEGPKFVPGQVVDTQGGPKFIPGQTIDTEEGPRFVPGQIVETRAGPTFIPGQVISTDEEGSRFVPGQVVETVEGPRFVPGRVIETGDHVTFIPGQVVETSEGLRFVAPDLQSSPEGDCQFTVQGFEITPEELSLLQTKIGPSSISSPGAAGVMSINSQMLKQLAEAGMAIGRQCPADIPVVDVRTIPAMSLAYNVAKKFNLDAVSAVKLSQVLASVTQFICDPAIVIRGDSEEVKILHDMMKAIATSMESGDSETEILYEIGSVFEKYLKMSSSILDTVDNFHRFVTTSDELQPLRKTSKVNLLKDIIRGKSNTDKIVESISAALYDDEVIMSSAFKHLSEGRPEIVDRIVKKVLESKNRLSSEHEASETLHRAIVSTVRETSELSIQELLKDAEGLGLKTLILEAVGLACALGMSDVANSLLTVLSDSRSTEVLAGDRLTLDILRRLTVMRQLAERRPELLSALRRLQSDPVSARSDPSIRQLVRESAALLVIPEEALPLLTSKDLPSSMHNNSLAMEDLLTRSRSRILMILKKGWQAVIPREASRLVLTGQVAYTVLDETGLKYFQPLHVFTALRLPPVVTHRYSMYQNAVHDVTRECSTTPCSSISSHGQDLLAHNESFQETCSASDGFAGVDVDSISAHRGERFIK